MSSAWNQLVVVKSTARCLLADDKTIKTHEKMALGFSRLSWKVLNLVQGPEFSQVRHLNCHRASIASIGRAAYVRTYPTLLVQADGSTITVRYKEPRAIIKMPLDLSTLSDSEKQKRLEMRKPKRKLKIEEEIEDSFDSNSYSHLWKKT